MIFLDLLILAVLAGAFFIGRKRGLLRTLWGFIALILTIAITSMLHPLAVGFLKSGEAAENLKQYVYTALDSRTNADIVSAAESLGGIYRLPDDIVKNAETALENSRETTVSAISEAVTNQILNILTAIVLLILVRLLLALAYRIIQCIFKLPVLKQTNRLAGGIVQLAAALAVIYGIFALCAAFGYDITSGTFLCKMMYNHNILLKIIGIG